MMKTDKNISLELFSFSTINTQSYVENAHKLRGAAIAEHIGIVKNVFKRKTSATKLKK